MNAISIENGALAYGTQPVPQPGKGEVLIRVAYAGVNRADLFQMQGSYEPPPGASTLPGLEVSGHIVETGEPVCALLSGGGYAEYCVVDARHCLPIPKGMDLKQAAALPETFVTVWMAVFEQAALQPGESLLVHGGASGIGTAAIQLGKLFGSPVYVTAGTAEKVALCEKLGATAWNYHEVDFVEEIKQATGKGADVILDMVGGDYAPRNLKALAPRGRMVQIALLRGAKAEVNLGGLLMKHLSWFGSTLRSRSAEEKAALIAGLREKVWPALVDGRVFPVLDSEFPLKQAEKALQRMEEGLNCGKIVLQVQAG